MLVTSCAEQLSPLPAYNMMGSRFVLTSRHCYYRIHMHDGFTSKALQTQSGDGVPTTPELTTNEKDTLPSAMHSAQPNIV